jgi:hypothetical protein
VGATQHGGQGAPLHVVVHQVLVGLAVDRVV